MDDFSQLNEIYPGVVMRPLEPNIPIVAEVLHPRSKPLSRLAAEFVKSLALLSAVTAACGRGAADLSRNIHGTGRVAIHV